MLLDWAEIAMQSEIEFKRYYYCVTMPWINVS
jgi:hypothetical protein